MRYSALTPLKHQKSLKRESLCTFDTETKDGLRGQEIFCWSFCYKEGKEIKVAQGKTMDEFFSFLSNYSLSLRKGRKKTIYVHNLGFDARFLIDYCIRHNLAYFPVISGGNMILLYLSDYQNIHFADSFQFIKAKQEKAEIEWNVDESLRKIDCSDLFEKNYAEWSVEDKERVLAHNRNDVLALFDIMDKFRTTMYELCNVDIFQINTPASLSMKAFRKTLDAPMLNGFVKEGFNKKEKRFYYTVDMVKAEFARKSYFGGRTECFNQNTLSPAFYVDRVSMYPAVMESQMFPDGIPFWVKGHNQIAKYLNDGKLAIVEAIVEPQKYLSKPVLPNVREGKLCFSLEKQKGVWCSPELDYAVKCGYKVKLLKALVYPKKISPFKKYIRTLIEVKKKSKGGKRLGAKILLNSLYGKFGQKYTQISTEYEFFLEEEEALDRLAEISEFTTGTVEYLEIYNCYMLKFRSERKQVKTFQNVAIASFVTAYARVDLLKLIHSLENDGNEVYYCDTDSVVIDNVKGLQLGKELGDWDIEHQFSAFKPYCPKVYCALKSDNTFLLKCKGVPSKRIREIEANSSSIEEIEGQIKNVLIESEIKYMPLKSSLNRRKSALGVDSNSKTLTLQNTKRVVLKSGKTEPFGFERFVKTTQVATLEAS